MVIDINTVLYIIMFHMPKAPVSEWSIVVFTDDGPILENLMGQMEKMHRMHCFEGLHASHVVHAAHLDPRFHHNKVRGEYMRKDYKRRVDKANKKHYYI